MLPVYHNLPVNSGYRAGNYVNLYLKLVKVMYSLKLCHNKHSSFDIFISTCFDMCLKLRIEQRIDQRIRIVQCLQYLDAVGLIIAK